MKYKFINKDINDNAIMFFAGWGMDETPFQWAKNMPLDFIVIYDYSNLDLNIDLSKYRNIYVFAWSFGVYAASKWLAKTQVFPLLSVAINGTPKPIDDKLGIPVNIFEGTLENLSDLSLQKFNKRMCGLENLKTFNCNKPHRDIDSLKAELITMKDSCRDKTDLFQNWDKVFVSGKDYIFPTENQNNYWESTNSIKIYLDEEYHYPADFQAIFESCFIDKEAVKHKFEQSFYNYDDYAIGQSSIVETLMGKWLNHKIKKDSTILEIGCGTGLFTKEYTFKIKPKKIYLNDIATIPDSVLPKGYVYDKIEGDAESCPLPNCLDYIVSTSVMQWFENPSCFIKKTINLLNDDGYLIMSTFGNKNMIELRNFFKSSLNYTSCENWKMIVTNAGYSEVEVNEECFRIYYNSVHDLLNGLKKTGVNALKSASAFNKSVLLRMEKEMPTENGKFYLSFNPIYIIAKK